MSDIREIDLRLVDATILLVFLGCMRHRKATVVAREMGLTQPAVSHALKRLRAIYGDPLFLRRAHGLEPTSLARELEPKVRRIVRMIAETLSEHEDFDPKRTKVDLKIGAFDYELTTVLLDLIADLRTVSPNIGIHTFPLVNRDALDALVDGRIDMAIGYFDIPANSADIFVADKLCTERYVVAAHKNHALFGDDLSLERFATEEHLLVSPFGPARGLVDHALKLSGYRRNVQTTVPSLFAALSIIERSDLVVTLPERVAARNARRFNLRHVPLPIDGGTFELQAVRHVRDAQSALHIWLVKQLKALITDGTI